MSYTCLPWPTTGATLHSVRIMQKCAQNVQKCAKKSFFGQILAKKRIFDAPKIFFLLFSFQKWIPLEKLDIKHVLYDFLHAISIIFKGVKKNVSIALSNYTRNSCAGWRSCSWPPRSTWPPPPPAWTACGLEGRKEPRLEAYEGQFGKKRSDSEAIVYSATKAYKDIGDTGQVSFFSKVLLS